MKMSKLFAMAAVVTATAAFAATPDALIHRWSFNNSLEDTGSIGGMTVTLQGNAALYNKTCVRVQRGGDPVELGANPIPSDLGDTPFTIEVWATPTSLDTYRGMFSLGERSNTSAKGLMGVFQGFRQINYTGGYGGENGPVWQAVAGKVNNSTGQNVAMTPGGISANTPYYFAYVVMPKGDNSSATVIGYVYNASTSEQVGKSTMYTVTDWTTSQLAQSWFGLGTTPWGDATPGADYDEVRVWKTALTPGQVAAHVAHGPDAIPGDGSVSDGRLRTESATLAHRWSFNGSLADSVTGDTATMNGAYYAANGAVRFAGGSKADNYVALGANKMPSDSVTIEFFSTVYTHVNWAKMFCLGSGENNGISFSYHRGDGTTKAGIEFKPDGNVDRFVYLDENKPYHFTFTFSCDGTDTVVKGYCIDLTDPGTIKSQFTDTLANWKMRTNITLDVFNLGWSFWNDSAVNADFDEVRVWDGVLSEAEVLKSAAAGADATINPSFVEAPEELIHRWSFNGNLEDTGSIGLNTATIKGNAGLLNGNSVRVNAGGNGTSWVELGGNPIPSNLGDTPFTIEVWATLNSRQDYASVFSIGERGTGGDPTVKGLMGVFHGFRQVRESGDAQWGACVQPLCGSMSNVAMTQGELSNGTAYYFAYVVTPQGNGSATLMGYVYNAYTGALVGQSVMRTVTGWTTAQLVQSTFNLGTTCWNNNNPGADYDEVRVWKKALTADQVAVSVRCGPDVVPGASATVNPVVEEGKPATLLHRWSFNGSLADTGVYGGSDAVTFGTAKLVDGTSVATYKDGGWNTSYVSLGANMIPASLGNTPFTIEMWATPRDLQVYLPAFTFGKPDDSSASNDALMLVFLGYGQIRPNGNAQNAPVFQALGSNYHEQNVSMSATALTVDTRYHISLVVEPQADDTVTITGYVHDDAGNLVGSGAQTGITGWNATTLMQYAFLLGRNPWHNANPSAEYDEVRIWSRAFTAGELSVNAKNGPDTIIDFDAPVEPDSYLHWVQSTGSQFIELPGVTGRTGTKIQAVISGFSGGGQVLVGSHSSAGHISWKDDGYGYVGMGYKDKTSWGLNGGWGTGKGTLTSQISPAEFTLDFNGYSTWYSDGYNPNKLSDGDKTAYDTGLDMYVFALNDSGTAANRASCKLYSLKIWQTATTDGTGDYTLVADLKPCVKNGLAALYDAVSGKVLFSDGTAPLTAGPVFTPHPSGCLMDYTFTSGAKSYSGTLEEPVTTAPGYTAVHGTNGYGTAVHAVGYAINNDDIKTTLAGEWTLATSFKSCDIEKGVLLSLGDVPANGTKQLAILSSSTEGRLYAAVVQRWGGTDAINRSLDDQTIAVSGADFTKEFHTLVVTHVPTDATNTGILTIYVDGVQAHQFTTVNLGQERAFGGGFRFGALMDNGRKTSLPSDIASTVYCPDTAFQNVRLYGKVLSADEIAAYAAEFPAAAATKGSIGDYGFRHSFSTGKLVSENGTFASTGGFNDNGLAGTGTAVDAPAYAAEGVKACFPDKTGYGTVTGGLIRDWTIAMSVKGPTVVSGNPAAMFSFGGVEDSTKECRSIALCSSSTGSLFVQMVQRWGSGNDAVNAPVSLDLGGDTSSMFHTLVIVNERNIRTDENLNTQWNTGMISFYLDGEYKGSLTDNNGQERVLMDMIRYGAIYNRTHESVVEPDAASGLSFQDLRFIPQVWTGAEAKDYAAAFPVAPTANVTLEVSGDDDFAGSQQIAITGGGQIYYTLDGSEPTPENGTLYAGAFTLAGSAQFKARAFADGQPVSQTVSRTFTEATDTAAYDYVFRYNFTDGAKIYNHHGCATEPAGTAAGYAAVHGTNGYAKAIHPTGYGTIVDGMARLNNDWTLAMCVKPGDLEKGILLSLGDNNAVNTKELAICSSSTAGRIHVAVVQKWTTNTGVANYKNMPFAYDIPVGGDTAGSFHSLVVTHVANTAYDAGTGQAHSGVITFYWDGVNVGGFDSSTNGGEREFGNGFKFGGLHDGSTAWLAQQGYVETAYDVESAFRDVRFYARTLTADEIAGYAAMFPAADSTSGNIGTFDFRHDFTGGSLAVTGSAFTDGGIAAATKEVLGPVDDDAAKAAWPGMSGYGTIGGVNMNGDWTLAMSVKAPKVADDEKGIMLSLGGVNAKGVKALTIGSTSDSTGGLFFGLAQRWGGDTTAINTCNGQVTLTGLGDTTKEFHSLVVVHASGLRTNNDSGWKTGTYAIYWDGVYKGAVATNDGAGQNIGNFIKYGSLHDRMPPTPGSWGGNYPHYVETDSSESGLAFRDLRFAGRMWTGTEVKAYSQAFPAVKQKSRGITVLVY